MMAQFASIAAISAMAGSVRDVASTTAAMTAAPAARGPNAMGFADLLASGLRSVDAKVAKADALIQSYAIGDPVPVHQVTLAIEQARMSIEMASQVRSKLVDTYHDFMNMQI